MTTVLVDARPHATAVITAVSTALGPNDAYDLDDVPGENGNVGVLPDIYVVVYVERRYNPNLRSSAQAGSAGWRISARSVGRSVGECRWAMNKVAAALNEAVLTISGVKTSRIQFENDEPPALDGGRYSALSRWTYAH